jgi:hypothetical protein
MKHLITLSLVLFALKSISQNEWKCIYIDSIFTSFADSSMKMFADNMRGKDMPEEVINAVLEKFKTSPPYQKRIRYVIAGPDSTLISTEVSDEGNLRISSFNDKDVLLKNGDLYFMSGSGRYDSLLISPRKVFKPSRDQPIFFNYTCKEYISTDSSCIIWVAEVLPSYINPGIRADGIKGAVLFYELKTSRFIIRCRITRLEQQKGKKLS